MSKSAPRTPCPVWEQTQDSGEGKRFLWQRVAHPYPDLNFTASSKEHPFKIDQLRDPGRLSKMLSSATQDFSGPRDLRSRSPNCPTLWAPVFLAWPMWALRDGEKKGPMSEFQNGVMNPLISTHCLYIMLRGTNTWNWARPAKIKKG